jgi:hypothetical protein
LHSCLSSSFLPSSLTSSLLLLACHTVRTRIEFRI